MIDRVQQADDAPVVHHQRVAIDLERLEAAPEEPRQPLHRVVEGLGRRAFGPAPPGEVEGDRGPLDPLEERQPVAGARRAAMGEDDGRAVARHPADEDADPVDGDGLLLYRRHPARPYPPGVARAARPDAWRRPRRARVRAIRDRLRELYGRPVNHPHGHPIAELVRTVLSQNTNDRNRDVAYERLRERFPTWVEVRDAPTDEVEEAIRPGGLSQTKAPRIQEILRLLPLDDGEPTL